jgi:ADP-L-glycero-D-manno-heptose 6-epimerase
MQDENTYPAQCVGLKFFNVYGPGEAHKGRMASMVFHAFHQIQSTGKIKLFKSHRPDFADGGQLRDFIYVDQVVDTIRHYLDHSGTSGLFNVGTGKARSFRDLGEAVFKALGRAVQIEYIPMPEDIRDKYQYFTEAVMNKSRHAGILPSEIPLEMGVSDYVHRLLRS